ncbi:MAG: DUF167 domain-containing protein [Nanoarchaeota archaeon]|nr:DUF167 domain-containing protein [Nanoarchaeota archaeon]
MRFNLTVKTNAKKNKIELIEEGSYKVYIKAPPEKGKANMEIIKLFSRKFKSPAKIIKGKSSKKKVIEI